MLPSKSAASVRLTKTIEGTDIVYNHAYDIGVAVSTERGLMVPVVRDCDRLGFAAIEKALIAVKGMSPPEQSEVGKSLAEIVGKNPNQASRIRDIVARSGVNIGRL